MIDRRLGKAALFGLSNQDNGLDLGFTGADRRQSKQRRFGEILEVLIW
jgi:hypothetical protein